MKCALGTEAPKENRVRLPAFRFHRRPVVESHLFRLSSRGRGEASAKSANTGGGTNFAATTRGRFKSILRFPNTLVTPSAKCSSASKARNHFTKSFWSSSCSFLFWLSPYALLVIAVLYLSLLFDNVEKKMYSISGSLGCAEILSSRSGIRIVSCRSKE